MSETFLSQKLNSFSKLRLELEKKLPYEANLVQIIKANENAHSRILASILNYTVDGEYILLKELLTRLGSSFRNIVVGKPKITVEKYRIDLLISDNNYSIIIENKINHATDQDKQLQRYTEIVKNEIGCDLSNIYVLYLTDSGGSPTKDSESISNELKSKLDDRYKEVSFKYDIVPWIRMCIADREYKGDEQFIYLLKQYVDYFEKRYKQRKNEHDMYNKLCDKIKEDLGIKEADIDSAISTIDKTQSDLDEYAKYITKIKEEVIETEFGKIEKIIEEIFPDHQIVKNIDTNSFPKYIYVGASIKFNGRNLSCSVGLDNFNNGKEDKPYFGLTVRGCDVEKKDDVLTEEVQNIDFINGKGFGISPRWYAYKKCDYKDLEKSFRDFTQNIKDKLNV
jgi:hypothetical protein